MSLITSLSLTQQLAAEYLSFFNKAQVKPQAVNKAERYYQIMIANKARYQAVANAFGLKGIPWYLIAVLHMRESTFSWTRHLAEGSPLTNRTQLVPKGLPYENPKAGVGKPYTWEEGAIAAIKLKIGGYGKNLGSPQWMNFAQDDSLPSLLNKIEAFNGAGYRKNFALPSPYLWADSTVQKPGKYVADGKFDASVVDTQMGAGTLLKYFLEKESKKKIGTI